MSITLTDVAIAAISVMLLVGAGAGFLYRRGEEPGRRRGE